MGKKRRTKKQKVNAKHAFEYSWSPSSIEPKKKESVKRQKYLASIGTGVNSKPHKNAKDSDSLSLSVDLKKDLVKSLSLAGLILGLELMLYFIW